MNFFEKELRTMFEYKAMLKGQKYCGKTMLAKLDEKLLVKLFFKATVSSEHYDAIMVSIINRSDGEIDRQTFKFSDIIGKQKLRNKDDISPYIWEYGSEPEWYVPIGISEKEKIADTILGYIGMYQSETPSMAMYHNM